MSNEYFNHDDPAKAGTKVAAAQYNNTMLSVEAGFDKLPTPEQFLLDNSRYGIATVAATNVFNLTLAALSTITGYVEGMGVLVKFPVDNTGACQLNVNGWGLKEMRSPFGATLQEGDIVTGVIYDLRYDGTYFQVLNAVESSLTQVTELVQQATDAANAATAAATSATQAATDAQYYADQSHIKYDELVTLVDNLQTLPVATTTVLGTVRLTDDYTNPGATANAVLTAVGANAMYQFMNGRALAVHGHTWSQITGAPFGTTSQAGIVQLNNDPTSNSTTTAATPAALKTIYDQIATRAQAFHTHPWSQITNVPYATTSQPGIVQLSSSVDSNSTTLAATASTIFWLRQQLDGKAPLVHTHTWSQVTGVPNATATVAGVARIIDTLTSIDPTAALSAKQGYYLGLSVEGKAPIAHNHEWGDITGIPTASTTVLGLTRITDDINNTSSTGMAISAKGAKAVIDAINARMSVGNFGSTEVGGIIFGMNGPAGGFVDVGTEYANVYIADMAGNNYGKAPGTWVGAGKVGGNLAGGYKVTLFWRIR